MPSYDGEKIRHAKIDNSASSGDTTVVSAVTGKYIVVLAYNFICAGSTNVKFKSGSTDISGQGNFVANTGKAVAGGAWAIMKTAKGEALVLNSSAAVQVGGELTYAIADRDDY